MSSKTISQFCRDNGNLSRGSYYNMKKRGTGPREMRDGKIVRISVEAETDWKREREAAAKVSA